jgi:hypothetical protein
MRSIYPILLSCVCVHAPAQTILNAYARITAISNASVLSLSHVNISNHTFTVGGSVIVMQMQDNVIGTNTANNNAFGNLATIANAGRYEVRTIAAVTPTSGTPTSITLSAPLSITFNTGANASAQLISFRALGTNFSTTSNIGGLAWNGNIGGVIAFSVTSTLTLNHQVTADGIGFRGGVTSTAAGADFPCVSTSYISTLTTLGGKGEGIYLPSVSSYTRARARIINGGGGGSENNAGGGGGGNYTEGGTGGLGYPCNATNSGRGFGGLGLSAHIGAGRVFMGGGGGGGQGNNMATTTAGGNGGGIILIKATTIASSGSCGSGAIISANGLTAGNSGGDGAGGGGAGGSVVIEASLFSINPACALTVRTNGGNGGNVGSSAAHGGGAGGGQGVVVYSSSQPTMNVTTQTNNGSAGADNSGGTVTAGNGGGSNGSGIISSGSGPLPVEWLRFTGTLQDTRVLLDWSTATETNNDYFIVERSIDGRDYTAVSGRIRGAGTSYSYQGYQVYDHEPRPGLNYYRIRQTDYNGDHKYSPLISVDVSAGQDAFFFPNPLRRGEPLSFVFRNASGFRTWTVTVCDMTGKELHSETFRTGQESDGPQEWGSPDLQPGAYLLKVRGEAFIQVRKLMVE